MTKSQDAGQLLAAIESDSEAIAQLLRSCGSSQHFGPERQLQFERLLRHRRLLIAKLESLRYGGRSHRMASGE